MQKSILLFTLLCCSCLLTAQNLNSSSISNRLFQRIEAQPESFHPIYILLADKVDVRARDTDFYNRNATLKERSSEIITELQAKANATQPIILEMLHTSKKVKKSSVRPFWIANVIFAEAKKEMIALLSNMDEVEWIDLNNPLELENYERVSTSPPLLEPDGTEPGLRAINAPALWNMGYTGYGRSAFILDTGTIPHHPALRSQYKGNHVPEHQAWFELNQLPPFDCNDHGTHVCGTVMGLDRQTNDTIGVAYNANWMASPYIGCSQAEGYPGTLELIAAFQWAMNPDSNLQTIHDMPDAINNSWHDPTIEDDCTSMYLLALTALETAGVAVVFSAGNAGPEPSTITKPHNINLDLVNTFAVGALNANTANYPIADFSSRGPSACGGDSSILIKPEVSAPGFSVRSSVRDGTYDFFNGTSMAAPHVTGAILLLKEAFPSLTGTQLKLALYYNCRDLGISGEDNTYGMGIINVKAAYDYLIEQGHLPVEPVLAENDIMLIDLTTDLVYCENKLDYEMVVENAGTTTIQSFEWTLSLIKDSILIEETFLWAGVLEPGERRPIGGELATMPPKGDYEMLIDLQQPNGETDNRGLNDVLKTPIVVSDRDLFPIAIAGQIEQVCEGTATLLRSNFEGNANVTWYDVPENGEPIGTGNTFMTAPLDSTQTFYAEAIISEKVGMEHPDVGERRIDSLGGRIIFDAHLPFTLKAFTIYAAEKGGRIFQLKRPDGTSLGSRVVSIPEPGVHRIQVDFQVPAERFLILEQQAGKPLYYTVGGVSYPYQVENIATIKGSEFFPDENDNTYYYCYDWEIEYDDFCERSPVSVEVVEGEQLPEAAFSASTEMVDVQNSTEVNFTNTSTNAEFWFWEFGDGSISVEENPSYVFQNPGIYTVSLTAMHPSGCVAYATMQIEVTDSSISSTSNPFSEEDLVLVYPNPTTGELNIELKNSKEIIEGVKIYTGLGILIKNIENIQDYQFQLNLGVETPGIYFLTIETENKIMVRKLVLR